MQDLNNSRMVIWIIKNSKWNLAEIIGKNISNDVDVSIANFRSLESTVFYHKTLFGNKGFLEISIRDVLDYL